nr:MAG TPA: hypothetical protein [Bacteriophage sp.]DAY45656.1 MAG TPA: hypothetical protein [Caudoviricetes sp.]
MRSNAGRPRWIRIKNNFGKPDKETGRPPASS